MKRLYLALFLGMTLVLSACGAGNQAAPTPSPTAELSEASVPAAAQPAENQAQKVAQTQTDRADYTIERQDRSVANKDGSTALSWYYDLVQLTGDTPEIQAINDSLNSRCDEFFAENSGNLPLEKQPDDLWLNTMEAAVTQNGDGLLSVCMTRTWYMGGVANADYLGYTYDLSTGQAVGLAGLTSQDPDTLATTLREIVKAYMAGQPEAGWWDDAVDKVDSRSLEDMIFWVDGGEIVLCFETYDLTIGAYGPVVIPTGVMGGTE